MTRWCGLITPASGVQCSTSCGGRGAESAASHDHIQRAGRAERNGDHSVPKINLVSRMQALIHSGCLHMPDSLPLEKTFRRELLDFRVSYSAVGNATFGVRARVRTTT